MWLESVIFDLLLFFPFCQKLVLITIKKHSFSFPFSANPWVKCERLSEEEHLSLCEVQVHGDLVAPEPGQVVVVGELGLQLSQLLLGERRALLPGLAAGICLKTGVLDVWREKREASDAFLQFNSSHKRRFSNSPICRWFSRFDVIMYFT